MCKKIFWIILVLLLIATPVMAYDVNADNRIDISDVVLVMRHVLQIDLLNQEQQARADINQDGVIDIRDVTLLMRHVLNAAEAPLETVNKVSLLQHNDYIFTQQVIITNIGSEVSSNIQITIPTLKNDSQYQTTQIITDYSDATKSFDLAPGEQKIIELQYQITNYSIKVEGNHDLIYSIYKNHASSGNCRELARAFIQECQVNNIQAREVIGYARSQRGNMTAGDLSGCRHSWAEVHIDDLGWVPVDLTFGYFLELPHTSHIIEGYYDESISINYSGGELLAAWNNFIK